MILSSIRVSIVILVMIINYVHIYSINTLYRSGAAAAQILTLGTPVLQYNCASNPERSAVLFVWAHDRCSTCSRSGLYNRTCNVVPRSMVTNDFIVLYCITPVQ
jgi:hypothetical protein